MDICLDQFASIFICRIVYSDVYIEYTYSASFVSDMCFDLCLCHHRNQCKQALLARHCYQGRRRLCWLGLAVAVAEFHEVDGCRAMLSELLKNPGCLVYIGDYTTQLYSDFHIPL